jgi:hypothetical protein
MPRALYGANPQMLAGKPHSVHRIEPPRDVRFGVIFGSRTASGSGPFMPQQRTRSDCSGMSVSCQQRTHAPRGRALFNHLIGAGEQRGWHAEAERLAVLRLMTKFEPGRQFTGRSPGSVPSILCPLPNRQLHKYQPAGPRDARVGRHNLLIVHVTRDAGPPCRTGCKRLLHMSEG